MKKTNFLSMETSLRNKVALVFSFILLTGAACKKTSLPQDATTSEGKGGIPGIRYRRLFHNGLQ